MAIDQFNQTISIWIDALDQYTYDQLILKPRPDEWSAGQVYMHLIGETNWYCGQIELCLHERKHVNASMNEEGLALFARRAFPDIKIINDQPSTQNIEQPQNVVQLRMLFCEMKNTMNDYWRRIEESPDSGKTLHPGMGYFSAREWFQFAEMHMRHHLRQKSRLDLFLISS